MPTVRRRAPAFGGCRLFPRSEENSQTVENTRSSFGLADTQAAADNTGFPGVLQRGNDLPCGAASGAAVKLRFSAIALRFGPRSTQTLAERQLPAERPPHAPGAPHQGGEVVAGGAGGTFHDSGQRKSCPSNVYR